MGRVASYKLEQRLEAQKAEAREKQLDFLVGQTAQYTQMLTDGMADPGQEGPGALGGGLPAKPEKPKVEKVDRAAERAGHHVPVPERENLLLQQHLLLLARRLRVPRRAQPQQPVLDRLARHAVIEGADGRREHGVQRR